MTRKDEETKEQEALLVLLMLMVFPPKIIIIISTKNRKIARRKVSFCCYLAFHFPFFCVFVLVLTLRMLLWLLLFLLLTISQQHRASCSSTEWCACDQYFRQKHLKGRFSLITLIMSISFPFILFSIFVFGNFRTTFNVKQCKLVLRS